MTTIPEAWLSAPEAAEALGIAQRDVRNMLADQRILAVRRGKTVALAISFLTLVSEGGKAAVLPSLRGTLTVSSDAGYGDEGAWRWLTATNGELGERLIDTLRAGRIHAVCRAAATLVF